VEMRKEKRESEMSDGSGKGRVNGRTPQYSGNVWSYESVLLN